ncbi:MAG TPA: DeoR/GlpR family DNA-binding transcription regulator [Bacillales bacterium]|nr:DeoR/GlpR family DNA-binding transcription regulator [Bacillales bacterium]
MFAEERREHIIKKLEKEKRVLVKGLAEELDVSIDTIRRDLALMEEKGLLKRTHGGAVSASKVRTFPSPPSVRYGEGTTQQNAIAREAASFIEPGDTVFISSASLHYMMLKYLPTNEPLTVITNSTVVAEQLKARENIETFMVCGKVRPSGSVVDALATEFIKTLKIDTCFLVGGGLTAAHGVSTATAEEAGFQRAAAGVARRKICLSTYNKLGNEAFAQIVPAQSLDTVITDWDAPVEEINRLQDIGVQVIAVKKDGQNED